MHFAILVDGGFLKRKLYDRKTKKHASAKDVSDFVAAISRHKYFGEMRLYRIYYYDAKPLEDRVQKPLNGGQVDFGASPVATMNKQLFNALAMEPGFAMRYGELSHHGWRLKKKVLETKAAADQVSIDADSIEPAVQQKGVDMRLGLDIAALTLKRIAKVLVLVTGDSDFVPALKFARREGAQVVLVTLGHGIKPELREHADLVIDQSLADVLAF